MSELPKSWTYTPLSNLLTRFEAGLNVKCEERPPGPGERGLVKISAVTWGRFDELQSKTLPSSEHPDPDRKIQIGDLLLSRANTLELVGASVIVEQLNRDLYLSDKVLRLVVHEPSKRWINYALKTPALRKAIGEASSGNQLSMRNISQDSLRQLLLPLAPEREQERISDKLDTVLTRVDAVNTRLARVAPILKRFRQSVLAAATSGRLTEDFNGGVLSAWRDKRLQEVCQSIADGDHQAPPQATSGVPFVTISALSGGRLNLRKATRFVPESYFVALDDKRRPQPGDVLFSVTGSIGVPALVDTAEPFTFQRHIAILKPDVNQVSSAFLRFLLESDHVFKQALAVATGTAQMTVPLGGLRRIEVSLPPPEEQTEIVRRVETLFAFADRLEARLQNAQTATERLTPALLAKAFRGELVPQDPNDEPASELLRRLQQEAPSTSAKRGRKSAA